MNGRKRKDPQWSSLPNELLPIIGEHLDTRIDVLRFRAVCTSWRSSIVSPSRSKSSPLFTMKLPYLIVPDPLNRVRRSTRYFTLKESTLYRFEPLDHQDTNTSNNSGGRGGGGWLVEVEESSEPNKFRLLNPLSHHEIRVGRLALWRLGDENWTLLGETLDTFYTDILLYKGQFHAIDRVLETCMLWIDL